VLRHINKRMKYYMAPLEGITGYIYRSVHAKMFGCADKYFTPFLSANFGEKFQNREIRDILPENNTGVPLVVQLMGNHAGNFIRAAKDLKDIGYQEVNLNLGCPSGTVVSRGRGSGFLAKKEELNAFLYEIFEHTEIRLSIKTRIGKDHPDEWPALMDIFNQYHMEELIIHPRIQKDKYNNVPNLEVFKEALKSSKNPVCYNGDLFDRAAYEKFTADFPTVERVMLGRGVIANPGLIEEVAVGKKITLESFRAFHDTLFERYCKVLCGDKQVLSKMKELWYYMERSFTDPAPYCKKIKKAERCYEYMAAVSLLFNEQTLKN